MEERNVEFLEPSLQASKMMRIRVILLAVFLALPFYIFSGEAINISDSPGWESIAPRITVDPNGYIHVVWVERYSEAKGDVFYSRASPDGTGWSDPLKLSSVNTVDAATCSIDADGSGRLYVLWSDSNSVRLRIFSGGKWNSSIQVASGATNYFHTKVAASPDGDIYLVWWTENGRVYSRSRVNGSWESTKQISVSGRRSKVPDIAVGNNVVYACWVEKSGGLYRTVYSKRNRNYNSSWSSVKRVINNDLDHQNPTVELDSNDVAHIVWTTWIEGPRIVHYSYWKGTSFSSPEALSGKRMIHYPSLCERKNNLFACWQVGSYANGIGIYYNMSQNGEWSGEAAVPQSSGSTLSDVAASPDAELAYFVWDSRGEIYFCSLQGESPSPNIPPVAKFSFSPHTGLFPLKVTFNASASYDPDGTIVSYNWDFGDGGSGSGKNIHYIYQTWGSFPITLSVVDNDGAVGTKVSSIEILRLFQPLNIRYESFIDESLFFSRVIIEIYWDRNPKNDEIAEIAFYRIYKKRLGESNAFYRYIGEVNSDVFNFRDKDVEEDDQFVYTVTSVDNAGHESPIVESTGGATHNEKSDKEILK